MFVFRYFPVNLVLICHMVFCTPGVRFSYVSCPPGVDVSDFFCPHGVGCSFFCLYTPGVGVCHIHPLHLVLICHVCFNLLLILYGFMSTWPLCFLFFLSTLCLLFTFVMSTCCVFSYVPLHLVLFFCQVLFCTHGVLC